MSGVVAHDVSCCMDGVEQDIEASGPYCPPARDDEPVQLNHRFLVVFSVLLLRSRSWWSVGARGRAMLQSLDYLCECTSLSSGVGWIRSFTEIVSRPTQQPDSVLSQEFEAFAASERKSSAFFLWYFTGNTLCTTRHYGTWSFTALILHGTRPWSLRGVLGSRTLDVIKEIEDLIGTRTRGCHVCALDAT